MLFVLFVVGAVVVFACRPLLDQVAQRIPKGLVRVPVLVALGAVCFMLPAAALGVRVLSSDSEEIWKGFVYLTGALVGSFLSDVLRKLWRREWVRSWLA
jgi:predicted PurR-regulated permease PerM